MKKLIKRSFVWGTIIGIVALLVTPFGLSFRLVEVLRPVLSPSTYIMRMFLQPEGNVVVVGPMIWILTIGLNILIYSLVVYVILSIREKNG